MLRFTLLRILHAVPLLIAVILVIFLMQQMIPGDPVQAMVGDFPVPQAFRDAIELFIAQRSAVCAHLVVLRQSGAGRFRLLLPLAAPGSGTDSGARAACILLASAGFAVAIPLGMVIGVLTGTTRRAGVDQAWTTTTLVLYAVPTFWLGQLMVLLFAVKLNWFPTQGMGPLLSQAKGLDWMLERLYYMALPVGAFAVHEAMRVARIMRASVIDTLGRGYVVTARAKGLRRNTIIWRHILRNSKPAPGHHRRLRLRCRTGRRGVAGDGVYLAGSGPADDRGHPYQ